MIKSQQNIEHSRFQLLLNHAKKNNEDFNLLLIRYGIERFLYRLSISKYKKQFILKGASLFLIWSGKNYRVTRDIDFLGQGDSNINTLNKIFQEICKMPLKENDAITFDPDSVKVQPIRKNIQYGGTRITLMAILHNAKIPVQIDVGFGDAVTPAPENIEYPTIFNTKPPALRAYPKETLISEKFSAMVELGLMTSRLKDFYDICLISRLFEFDGVVLGQAITNTFNRQNTQIPEELPVALTNAFAENEQKQIQWKAFLRKAKPKEQLGTFVEVIKEISLFLLPVLEQVRKGSSLNKTWKPDKGWQ